jgi:aminopeptidase N
MKYPVLIALSLVLGSSAPADAREGEGHGGQPPRSSEGARHTCLPIPPGGSPSLANAPAPALGPLTTVLPTWLDTKLDLRFDWARQWLLGRLRSLCGHPRPAGCSMPKGFDV